MAFTEEEIEQLNTAVSEGGNITDLEFMKPLVDAGFSMYTEGQRLAKEQEHYQNGVAARTRELHEEYERDIREMSGLGKNQGEKAYDYMKRVYSQATSNAAGSKESIAKLNDQIQKLQAEKGIPTDEHNAAVQKLTEAKEMAEKALKEAMEGYAQENARREQKAVIMAQVSGLKRNPNIPESFFRTMVNSVTDNLIANHGIKEMNGDQYLTGKDGGYHLENGSAVKLGDYLRSQLKDGLDNGGGMGTNGNNGQPVTSHGITLNGLEWNEVLAQLSAARIPQGSPKYLEVRKAYLTLNQGKA